MTITFKDALNNEYEMGDELTLQLISTADAGHEDSKTGTIIIVVVILAAVLFFIYRKRKCKKHK